MSSSAIAGLLGCTGLLVAVVSLSGYRPVVNASIVVLSQDNGSVRAVRLSDGLGWNVPGEAGLPMLDGLWVNSELVWARVSPIPVGSPGFPTSGGVIRVKRSTLGPPTIPNGL